MKKLAHGIKRLSWMSLLGLAGCAATQQAPTPTYTGFLPDYGLLQQGEKGQAERVYIKSNVDWSSYTKIMLDPVTLWRGQESKLDGISPEDAQTLADHFYTLIYEKFSQDFEMVNQPGPQTLRFSVALVKLEEARIVMETISTVVPQLHLTAKLTNKVSGWSPLIGKASIEAKVTDAQTGTLLIEGVDERIGAMTFSSLSLKSWGDVEHVMKLWVDRSFENLRAARHSAPSTNSADGR